LEVSKRLGPRFVNPPDLRKGRGGAASFIVYPSGFETSMHQGSVETSMHQGSVETSMHQGSFETSLHHSSVETSLHPRRSP
jgi:hypothetical protein